MRNSRLRSIAPRAFLSMLVFAVVLRTPALFAWGSNGHRMINSIAVEKLPSDLPPFLRAPAAVAEITDLGPEPDRWRSPMEPELNAAQAPEHFIDLEIADTIGTLPRKRFDYIADLYAAGLTHPDMARELRPERAGLLPYEAVEVFERLQAAMRTYRELQSNGQDTAPVQATIIFYAGWLGHYVGDGSQPLHVSVNYNGWTQKENPHNYGNDHKIHARFETEFVDRNIHRGDIEAIVAPVHVLNDPFADFVSYLRTTQSFMERVYQLDQQHGFDGAGTEESRRFTAERLAAAASMLRDMIDTAWVDSARPLPAYHD